VPHVPCGTEEEPLPEKARNTDQRGESGVTTYEQLFKSLIMGADQELTPKGDIAYFVIPFAHMSVVADRFGVELHD
jgi:hypothetical protein